MERCDGLDLALDPLDVLLLDFVLFGAEVRGADLVLRSLTWLLAEMLLRELVGRRTVTERLPALAVGLIGFVGALRVTDFERARAGDGREGVAFRLTLLRLVLAEDELRRAVAAELLVVRLAVCLLPAVRLRDRRARTALADIPKSTTRSRPMTNILRPLWSFSPNIRGLLSPAIYPAVKANRRAIAGYSLNSCSFPPVKGTNLASGNSKFPYEMTQVGTFFVDKPLSQLPYATVRQQDGRYWTCGDLRRRDSRRPIVPDGLARRTDYGILLAVTSRGQTQPWRIH